MTEEEYSIALQNLDNSNIEDHRKDYDLYVCDKCREFKITTCDNKGYAPMLFQCNHCSFGIMRYKRTTKHVKPTVVLSHWRRPTYKEFCEMSPRLQRQVLDGLLINDILC